MRTCTQQDIAKAAGVSQRAVASVVGNGANKSGARVSEETRKLILEVAKKMNYRPHRQAQLLRGVKSKTIGIIKPLEVASLHVEKAQHARRMIYDKGYSIMTSEHVDGGWLERNIHAAIDAKVEGVILLGFFSETEYPLLQKLTKAGIPVVAMPGGGLPPFPCVTTDHRQGVYDLVCHLVKSGHKRLFYTAPAVLKSEKEHLNWTNSERLAGFYQGVKDACLKNYKILHVDWRQQADHTRSDIYYAGRLLAEELLSFKKFPDAVLCSNDNWALGAIGHLQRAGVNVPKDIAVVGFDGMVVGEHICPSITTILQDAELLAKTAVEWLFRLIEGEKPDAHNQLINVPGELIVRESCGSTLKRKRRF